MRKQMLLSKQGKEVFRMTTITDKTYDEERALYNSDGVVLRNCIFDGPADGESVLKESRNVQVENSFFNLRYPFWHDDGLKIAGSRMTQLCRAALWYSEHIDITDTQLHGIKALRECADVRMRGCDVVSAEFGWSVRGIEMEDTSVQSEYFMMRSDNLRFRNVKLTGKYSFQYIEDAVFENCDFDTKDAFWHAKNVTVRNSTIKGEYLAWYCENVTLCYCKGLKLIDCEMVDTDLSFEKSEVEAVITTPVMSIKNPLAGHIYVPSVGEIIRDDAASKGEIVVERKCHCA